MEERAMFKAFGIDWVILDFEYPVSMGCNYVKEGATGILAITRKLVTESRFASSRNLKDPNNWKNSMVYQELEKFIERDIPCPDVLWSRFIDLRDAKGYGTYGIIPCRVSSLTAEEYQRYRERLPKYLGDWWTMTPTVSIPKVLNLIMVNTSVEAVSRTGNLYTSDVENIGVGFPAVCLFRKEFVDDMPVIREDGTEVPVIPPTYPVL